MTALKPPLLSETERVSRLRALAVLDTPPEAIFDALTRTAAIVCGAPIALVSLVDQHRQWFKSNVGLDGITETSREVAFCDHAIRDSALMIVADAAIDPRFENNPLVTSEPGIRFYAGAPIVLTDGSRLGSLCVIDREPRTLSTAQQQALTQLAATVSAALEMRERGLHAVSDVLAANARVTQIYQTSPAMLHAADADMRIVTVSDVWLANLGYRRDEVLGRRSIEFLTPAAQEYVRRIVLPDFYRTGRRDQIETQMMSKDGRIIDVSWSSILERGAADEVIGSFTVIQDITAQKLAERDFIQHRDRLNNVLEGTNAGSWEWDLQKNEFHLNERWAAIIGRTLFEVEPFSIERWRELTHPIDFAHSVSIANRHLTGEIDYYDCEIRMRHKLGHWVWVRSRGRVAVRDDEGQPVIMAGTHIDISERKAADATIKANQQLLERTGQIANVGGWEVDLRTNIVTWSEHTRRIHEVDVDYVPTMESTLSFFPGAARSRIEAALKSAMHDSVAWDLELPLLTAQGRSIWIRSSGEVEFDAGQAVRLIGAFQDISRRREAELALAESRELLQVTLESIGDAVITTDYEGRVRWLNPVAERLTGWANQEACGKLLVQVFNIINEESRFPAENPVSRCLAEGKIHGLASHTILKSLDGTEYGIEDSAAPIRDRDGNALGVVLVFHDVTEQRRLSKEMNYRATHDSLTGLPNRTEFELRLKRVLTRVQGDATENALMYIDLDQFKIVNDSCGHAAGDELLRQVTGLFQVCVRTRDTLARLGGDEFGVILEHCTTDQAGRVAQQICDQMSEFRFAHDEKRYRVGASIGLVPINAGSTSATNVMQAADNACYAAKEAGRNRVHIWRDQDQTIQARHGEMQWTHRIERAFDENRFELRAQQIVPLQDLSGGIHCEILLRLREVDGTVILPGAFLPAAERFHLVSRIDRWVVQQVFEWLTNIGPAINQFDTVAVNLSGQSIGDRAFHRFINERIAGANFPVSKLCFEITETVAVTSMGDAGGFIAEMRDREVRVALDDFGAGASSFGYLKSLPVNYLKIDGQFIKDLMTDAMDLATVRCFCEVASVVGIQTIAEFVEQSNVLAKLRELGVDFAQGFLLHRPESLNTFLAAMHDRPLPVTKLEIRKPASA